MIPGSDSNHPTFWRSFGFALQGFRFALRSERNIKVMVAGSIFAILCGFIVSLDATGWAIVLLCCGVVLMAELFNTAIETIVDLVSPEYHMLAGRAKDISAAAVYILCIFVAIIGVIVLGGAAINKFF